VDFFAFGVAARDVHGGREGKRNWDEILYLARFPGSVDEVFGQAQGVVGGAAWMGGDEVRDEVLLFAGAAGGVAETRFELLEELEGWFTHKIQNVRAEVLGCDF